MAFGFGMGFRFGSRGGGAPAEWLGDELVLDPPLDNPPIWNDTTGNIVVAGGAATFTAASSGSRLARSSGEDHKFLDDGDYYVTIVIDSITSGAIMLADNTGSTYGTAKTTPGTHEFLITGSAGNRFWLRAFGTTTAVVSYFSIRTVIGTPPGF